MLFFLKVSRVLMDCLILQLSHKTLLLSMASQSFSSFDHGLIDTDEVKHSGDEKDNVTPSKGGADECVNLL